LGKIGIGYGSEWHLLRYMGRHREALDRAILKVIGQGDGIEWLDFGFTGKRAQPDAELKGLEFLERPRDKRSAGVLKKWKKDFWPQTGRSQNWDAVGRFRIGRRRELLLVEAKAHTGELKSNGCKAKGKAKRQIENALADTIEDLKASKSAEDWCGEYYQYANRLAALHFLRREKVKARLVLIYFCGDQFRGGQTRKGKDDVCPTRKDGWKKALAEQDKHLGLPSNHRLAPFIHKIYLSVTG
jgi:hypothetical protein